MEADEVPLSKTERIRLLQLRRTIVVGIVGYGNTMAATAKRAADLYVSQAFQSARRWADACADDWVIVCPKHGLITPDSFLAPYRAKLGAMSVREKVEWGRSTILAIQHRYAEQQDKCDGKHLHHQHPHHQHPHHQHLHQQRVHIASTSSSASTSRPHRRQRPHRVHTISVAAINITTISVTTIGHTIVASICIGLLQAGVE